MKTTPSKSKRLKTDSSASEVPIRCTFTRLVPLADLKPNPRNPNKHPEAQLKLYAKAITHQGWRRAVVVSNQSGYIVTGHGAVEAARLAGWPSVPVDYQDFASPEDETAHMLADNRLSELSELNETELAAILKDLDGKIDLDLTGFDKDTLAGLDIGAGGSPMDSEAAHQTLAERFGVPPFTVLDARQGYWQERKRAWLALGIQSELGRGDCTPGGGGRELSEAKTCE